MRGANPPSNTHSSRTACLCSRIAPSHRQSNAARSFRNPLHSSHIKCRRFFGPKGFRGPKPCSAQEEGVVEVVESAENREENTVQENEGGVEQAGGASTVPQSDVWELDFCSRPLVDERRKKVWELLICSPDRTFEYSEYFPNNKINSAELKKCLQRVMAQEGAQPPKKVLFFRGQMQTIITRALSDLDITPVPSRRCVTIMSMLEDRLENVYKKDPRYSAKAQTLFVMDLGPPEELEDYLRGESWGFVQLPLEVLLNEIDDAQKGIIFGEGISLEGAGLGDMPKDTLVPGVSVYSRRAEPLAAWTNGLELACVNADFDRMCLILETGVNERWRYGSYRRSPETNNEAMAWEQAKKACRGLHFLAIQEDPEAECCTGLWLLVDRAPPSV